MVKDIDPGANSSYPSYMINVNNELYFTANDGSHGYELWKSDGTAAGTVMVKDIDAGASSSTPFDLAAVNGALEFYAFDGAGTGLFRSDGTAAGTIELAANVQASTPFGVTALPHGDFNGDSISDILWQNSNGQAASWELNGTSLIAGGSAVVGPNPGPSWTEIGTGDFNADSRSDILWQNASGQAAIWEMNGTSQIAGGSALVGPNPGPSWKVVGSGDFNGDGFNGDGFSDILWQNADGQAAIWEMNGLRPAFAISSADAHRQRRGLYRASPARQRPRLARLAVRPDDARCRSRGRSHALIYVPVIDNLLDVVATPAAFIAGTIVSAAVMIDAPPMVKWTAAVIAGGGVAGLTQGLTGVLRANSTVLTGGLGNSVIATAELGAAVLISFRRLPRQSRRSGWSSCSCWSRCGCCAGSFEAQNRRTGGRRRACRAVALSPAWLRR